MFVDGDDEFEKVYLLSFFCMVRGLMGSFVGLKKPYLESFNFIILFISGFIDYTTEDTEGRFPLGLLFEECVVLA